MKSVDCDILKNVIQKYALLGSNIKQLKLLLKLCVYSLSKYTVILLKYKNSSGRNENEY